MILILHGIFKKVLTITLQYVILFAGNKELHSK